MSASLSPRQSSSGAFVVLAASLLATIPIWLSTFPPMTDLPQHAAVIALLQAMRRGGFPYEASFEFNWFTPYLFGYLLVYGLLPFVGIVTACKIIVSLALAAMPVSTALLLTETETDPRWALLTIPAMYGFAYQWGFLNFLVAAPLGLLFLWLTFRQARNPTLGGAFALGAGVIALFFCHALICAFFGAIAGCILLLSAGTPSAAIRRLIPLTAVVPVIIVWAAGRVGRSVVRLPSVWDLNWFSTAEPYYDALAQWTTRGGWGWGRVTGLFPRLLGMRAGMAGGVVRARALSAPLRRGRPLDATAGEMDSVHRLRRDAAVPAGRALRRRLPLSTILRVRAAAVPRDARGTRRTDLAALDMAGVRGVGCRMDRHHVAEHDALRVGCGGVRPGARPHGAR